MLLDLRRLSTSTSARRSRVEQTVFRRSTCDKRIWTKPLAFAAGYKYTVWVFNFRFAILSPEPYRLSRFVVRESLGRAACYHSTQKKTLLTRKQPPLEHALASAAPAASRPDPDCSKSLQHP